MGNQAPDINVSFRPDTDTTISLVHDETGDDIAKVFVGALYPPSVGDLVGIREHEIDEGGLVDSMSSPKSATKTYRVTDRAIHFSDFEVNRPGDDDVVGTLVTLWVLPNDEYQEQS